MTTKPRVTVLREALEQLCSGKKIQSSEHISTLHKYCAARLVLEGGFPPDWVHPRPPFSASKRTNELYELKHDPAAEDGGEIQILGGIKYKNVDVTVAVPNVGPALAISVKQTGNAFRNLNNRMEEALGECTNVHLMYPGFVFGFLHAIKLVRTSEAARQDASFQATDEPLPSIERYHEALVSLCGRTSFTEPGMRYEAVGLLVYQCGQGGSIPWHGYPPPKSPVHFSRFFQSLYRQYDLRYGYPNPNGPNIRKAWQLRDAALDVVYDPKLRFPWKVRTAQ